MVYLVGNRRSAVNNSSNVLADVRIASTDSNSAAVVAGRFNEQDLDLALARNGLLDAKLVAAVIMVPSPTTTMAIDSTVAIIIAMLLFVLISGCICVIYLRRPIKEEQILITAVRILRRRLHIERSDGFLLANEWLPPWYSRSSIIFLPKNSMESAAQLSLMLDFSVAHFDAFCLYLMQATPSIEGQETRYNLICEWILELGARLLRPQFEVFSAETDIKIMADKERFAYFLKICRCQVSKS